MLVPQRAGIQGCEASGCKRRRLPWHSGHTFFNVCSWGWTVNVSQMRCQSPQLRGITLNPKP